MSPVCSGLRMLRRLSHATESGHQTATRNTTVHHHRGIASLHCLMFENGALQPPRSDLTPAGLWNDTDRRPPSVAAPPVTAVPPGCHSAVRPASAGAGGPPLPPTPAARAARTAAGGAPWSAAHRQGSPPLPPPPPLLLPLLLPPPPPGG